MFTVANETSGIRKEKFVAPKETLNVLTRLYALLKSSLLAAVLKLKEAKRTTSEVTKDFVRTPRSFIRVC